MKVSTGIKEINNNLTEAQQLRAEKEKARQLEAEYQRQLKKILIDKMIVFIDGGDLSATKLNIINNKYEIIEKAANEIYNMTEKKEVLNRTNENKITDTIIINKYNKNYIDITDDLSELFYKILSDLLKDETEKQKAEKETNKHLLYNYLDSLIKTGGIDKVSKNYILLQYEKMKKAVSSDLKMTYNQDFITLYNKTLKTLYNNYRTESEAEQAQQEAKNNRLSIWWKLAAITSLLDKKH